MSIEISDGNSFPHTYIVYIELLHQRRSTEQLKDIYIYIISLNIQMISHPQSLTHYHTHFSGFVLLYTRIVITADSVSLDFIRIFQLYFVCGCPVTRENEYSCVPICVCRLPAVIAIGVEQQHEHQQPQQHRLQHQQQQ